MSEIIYEISAEPESTEEAPGIDPDTEQELRDRIEELEAEVAYLKDKISDLEDDRDDAISERDRYSTALEEIGRFVSQRT